VTSTPADAARQTLKRATQSTSECISVERLGEALTPAERDHVAGCVRCQTEAALRDSFNDATPRRDEEAAVRRIVEELKRRNQNREGGTAAPVITPWRSWRPLLAIAATLVLAVTVGYVARDREPKVAGTDGTVPTYRSARVQLRSPVGDQSAVPSQLEWIAVPGAAAYEVSVLEVDRTLIWSGSSAGPRVALPSSVTVRLVPGKTVLWEVAATDAAGKPLAASGAQSFRVAVNR
jgi:hypothetical protein